MTLRAPGFSILAKIIPGREPVFYEHAKRLQDTIAAQPDALEVLKLHYLRWLLLPIGGETAGRRAMRSLELATLASEGEGDAFVRQLAWRDFFRQLVAADPRRTRDDLRPGRSPRWRHDPAAFDEWWTATPPATSGQWVAGTGANPRRGAALNIERQARRFDPEGAYGARNRRPSAAS